ncbi:hypothetical protein L7F22_037865 [Adiantum nelumboides]|nr:hypothetical protein [Adiantum nelumboides]
MGRKRRAREDVIHGQKEIKTSTIEIRPAKAEKAGAVLPRGVQNSTEGLYIIRLRRRANESVRKKMAAGYNHRIMVGMALAAVPLKVFLLGPSLICSYTASLLCLGAISAFSADCAFPAHLFLIELVEGAASYRGLRVIAHGSQLAGAAKAGADEGCSTFVPIRSVHHKRVRREHILGR